MVTQTGEIDDPTESLIYVISHDLRAPVRHIKAFTKILADHLGTELDDVAAGHLSRLVVAADTVNDRLDALSRYSLAINGQAERVRYCLDLAVANAVLVHADVIQRCNASVVVGPLPEVLCDPGQMTSLFTELIGNSLTYSGHESKIAVSSRTIDDKNEITISDNGPGLRSTDCESATQLFRRFHPASIPGTGTGLAIVKRIVEAHGGSVTIESPDRNGLQVRLLLPATIVQ